MKTRYVMTLCAVALTALVLAPASLGMRLAAAAPTPCPAGWVLQMRGAHSLDKYYRDFQALALSKAGVTYVDNSDPQNVVTYRGLNLRTVVGWSDDKYPTMYNTQLALADKYVIDVIGLDGFAHEFLSSDVAKAGNHIVLACFANGKPLTYGELDTLGPSPRWRPQWPLKLVGSALTSGKQKVAAVRGVFVKFVKPAASASLSSSSATTLLLKGKLTRRLALHSIATVATWDGRKAGNVNPKFRALFKGQMIYRLVALVDDKNPKTFNVALARKGYRIQLIGKDGYKWTIKSATIIGKTNWIVAKLKNGKLLTGKYAPLWYVGSFIKPFYGKPSVYGLIEIKLIF